MPDRTIRDTLNKYGEAKDIKEEQRTRAYRYRVSNGIRIVEMGLKHHLPSHMSIAGNRVLISYEEQPSTCYGCNETSHHYQDCPSRRRAAPPNNIPSTSTWADIFSQPTMNTCPETRQTPSRIHDTQSERLQNLYTTP